MGGSCCDCAGEKSGSGAKEKGPDPEDISRAEMWTCWESVTESNLSAGPEGEQVVTDLAALHSALSHPLILLSL